MLDCPLTSIAMEQFVIGSVWPTACWIAIVIHCLVTQWWWWTTTSTAVETSHVFTTLTDYFIKTTPQLSVWSGLARQVSRELLKIGKQLMKDLLELSSSLFHVYIWFDYWAGHSKFTRIKQEVFPLESLASECMLVFFNLKGLHPFFPTRRIFHLLLSAI